MEERDEKKGRKEMEEGNEKEIKEENDGQRQKAIDRVTIGGSMVNGVLLVFKFVAGVLGGSSAMIADAVHSLSDFVTDLVVLVFIRLSGKPQDKSHDFGHGKYETLATALIGGMLLAVGVMICVEGVSKIWGRAPWRGAAAARVDSPRGRPAERGLQGVVLPLHGPCGPTLSVVGSRGQCLAPSFRRPLLRGHERGYRRCHPPGRPMDHPRPPDGRGREWLHRLGGREAHSRSRSATCWRPACPTRWSSRSRASSARNRA